MLAIFCSLAKKNRTLNEFSYSNQEIMREIYSAMNSTDFDGVSGRVAFNSEGDRITWTQIEQMWGKCYWEDTSALETYKMHLPLQMANTMLLDYTILPTIT
jgi:hypothetical protein